MTVFHGVLAVARVALPDARVLVLRPGTLRGAHGDFDGVHVATAMRHVSLHLKPGVAKEDGILSRRPDAVLAEVRGIVQGVAGAAEMVLNERLVWARGDGGRLVQREEEVKAEAEGDNADHEEKFHGDPLLLRESVGPK